MDTSYERTLHGGRNPGWTRTLSRLDEVGAGVRLRARFAGLANEDMNSAEGNPVPLLDRASLRAPSFIVDVELATTTFGHPADHVPLKSFRASLQELDTIMR